MNGAIKIFIGAAAGATAAYLLLHMKETSKKKSLIDQIVKKLLPQVKQSLQTDISACSL